MATREELSFHYIGRRQELPPYIQKCNRTKKTPNLKIIGGTRRKEEDFFNPIIS